MCESGSGEFELGAEIKVSSCAQVSDDGVDSLHPAKDYYGGEDCLESFGTQSIGGGSHKTLHSRVLWSLPPCCHCSPMPFPCCSNNRSSASSQWTCCCRSMAFDVLQALNALKTKIMAVSFVWHGISDALFYLPCIHDVLNCIFYVWTWFVSTFSLSDLLVLVPPWSIDLKCSDCLMCL